MDALPVPLSTYKAMVDQCLTEVKQPRGTRVRRYVRKRRAARDAALLSLAFACGATVSELIGLKTKNWNPNPNRRSSPSTQASPRRIRGKPVARSQSDPRVTLPDRRSRSETLPLVGSTCKIQRLWAWQKDPSIRVFHPISKWGSYYQEQLSQRGIYEIITERYDQIKGKAPAPEPPNVQKLRKSFRKLLKREDVKDAIVRDLMDLRSRRTVSRNDQKADQKMKDALSIVAVIANPNRRIPSPPN
jgi:integrase